ncbi:MAG: hypothetical protein L6R39_007690, partial [Caloplaca ligustica]
RLVDDLRATQREINRTAEYIFNGMHGRARDGEEVRQKEWSGAEAQGRARGVALPGRGGPSGADDALYDEVQGLLKTCIKLFYEVDDLLKRSERDPHGFRRRMLFLMNRDEVADKVARLEGQKGRLGDIRMGLFLRKSAQHDAMLRQIAGSYAAAAAAQSAQAGDTASGVGQQHRRTSVDASMMDGETEWKSAFFESRSLPDPKTWFHK